MNKKRIFIAINLPEEIKKELESFKKEYHNKIPAKWVETKNFHLTLAFLGYLNENEIEKISQGIKEIVLKHHPFYLYLTEICYYPLPFPRLIWVKIKNSEPLKNLSRDLYDFLEASIGFVPEREEFIPHITLARIKKWRWQRLDIDEREEIDRKIELSFLVRSIEIEESILKRTGPEYKILESYSFLNNS